MESRSEVKPQLKKGLWKPEEDLLLKKYVETYGEGNWASVSERSGLMRGGKSCRLRWKNYLRPNLKHGEMSKEEEDLIIRMHKLLGNRWSLIAGRLPGRTDNEVKNYWNTHLNKRCPKAKRKIRDSIDKDDDKKKKRKKLFIPNESPESITEGLSEGKEEGSTITTERWIEETCRIFNYDMKSPLLAANNAAFFYDDEPLMMPFFDSFLWFEGVGSSGEETCSQEEMQIVMP